jgi:hypothetical protein
MMIIIIIMTIIITRFDFSNILLFITNSDDLTPQDLRHGVLQSFNGAYHYGY